MRTNADCTEIAAIAGQNPIDPAALRDSSYSPVDKSETELVESAVKLERPGNIGGKRQLVFIPRPRIEYLGHQLAHCFTILSKKIIHFGENECGDDNSSGRDQNALVLWKTGLTTRSAGERAQ